MIRRMAGRFQFPELTAGIPDGLPHRAEEFLRRNVRVITLPRLQPGDQPDRGAVGPDQGQPVQPGLDTLAEPGAVRQTELQRFWQDARRSTP
jgi:hypothetical protein